MKILMALNGLDIGGAETHVVELSKEIKRRGHDVVMVSSGGVYLKEVEDAGIKHHTVLLTSRKPWDMASSKKALKEIIMSEKPDIVHSHARIPGFLIDMIHKELDRSFVFVSTAHWTFDTSPLVKKLTHWGEKTLAVSDDLKKYLLKHYKEVKEENIYISINGIDGRKFNKDVCGKRVADEFKLTPNAKKIVYVSRLNPAVCAPAYGIIEKISKIDAAVPGVEVIIVGGGDCLEDMTQKADEANKLLGRRAIIMAGPRTDINEIHANADVCVGVSRAILEPMIMEKKCIVAGQEGYIGILTPEKLDMAIKCNFTCRGCEKLDFDKLSDDIIKLFDMNIEQSKEVTDYGKSVVETYYSVKKMADDNIKMYHDALRDCRYEAAILGYYGYGNSGDDALLRAIIDDIQKADPLFTPIVLSNNPEKTSKTYGVKCVNRFSLPDVAKVFKKTKLFILGGGSLIQDVTSTKSLLYYLYCIRLAKKNSLKVMLYANGIGPITKISNAKRAAKVLNMVDLITLRDSESAKLLEKMGVTKPEIILTADPAFGLTPCSDEQTKELKKSLGIDNKYICMSVRNWSDSSSEVFVSIAKMADYISKKHGLTPVFVPMQYSKDKQVSEKIISLMEQKGIFVDKALEIDHLLGLISHAEAVVAIRLHMLVFGACVNVPSIGIEYDPKVSSFQEYIGQPYCITPESIQDGTYTEVVDKFMAEKSDAKQVLADVLPFMKEKAFENAKIAVKLYGGN